MSPPPDPSAASDQELVAWARQGLEAGYRELLRRYQHSIYKLIYRMVREHEQAQDLVQETFVKAFGALGSYRPEFKFSSWILKIANNVAIDHLRRTRLEGVALEAAPYALTATAVAGRSESTPASVHARELRSAIEQAIGRLRGKYRRCVMLRYVEERSYDHIAEILNLPVGTVKSCVHRARNQLKDMLGPLHGTRGKHPFRETSLPSRK